jgi:hypothetical protein
MIDELKESYEYGDLNSWEAEFYESVRDRIGDGVELTRKQFDKLLAIYENYCE